MQMDLDKLRRVALITGASSELVDRLMAVCKLDNDDYRGRVVHGYAVDELLRSNPLGSYFTALAFCDEKGEMLVEVEDRISALIEGLNALDEDLLDRSVRVHRGLTLLLRTSVEDNNGYNACNVLKETIRAYLADPPTHKERLLQLTQGAEGAADQALPPLPSREEAVNRVLTQLGDRHDDFADLARMVCEEGGEAAWPMLHAQLRDEKKISDEDEWLLAPLFVVHADTGIWNRRVVWHRLLQREDRKEKA
jgi:hypothetical protein